jgi:hypothetical protein
MISSSYQLFLYSLTGGDVHLQVLASGGGTGTDKRLAPMPGVGGQFLSDNTGTYTLPSK